MWRICNMREVTNWDILSASKTDFNFTSNLEQNNIIDLHLKNGAINVLQRTQQHHPNFVPPSYCKIVHTYKHYCTLNFCYRLGFWCWYTRIELTRNYRRNIHSFMTGKYTLYRVKIHVTWSANEVDCVRQELLRNCALNILWLFVIVNHEFFHCVSCRGENEFFN